MKLSIVAMSLLSVVGVLLCAAAEDAETARDDIPAAAVASRRWCVCYAGICYCRHRATAGRALDERSMTDTEADELVSEERRADAVDPIQTYKDVGYSGETGTTRGWCACYGFACYCRHRGSRRVQLSDDMSAAEARSLTESQSLQEEEQRAVDASDATEDAVNSNGPVVGSRRWCACWNGLCYCRKHATTRRVLDERRADAVDPIQTYKDASYNGETGTTRGWCGCILIACYCRH